MGHKLDFFTALAIATIVCLVLSAIFATDYSGAASASEIEAALLEPLELKNWHYALLVVLIWLGIRRGK